MYLETSQAFGCCSSCRHFSEKVGDKLCGRKWVGKTPTTGSQKQTWLRYLLSCQNRSVASDCRLLLLSCCINIYFDLDSVRYNFPFSYQGTFQQINTTRRESGALCFGLIKSNLGRFQNKPRPQKFMNSSPTPPNPLRSRSSPPPIYINKA